VRRAATVRRARPGAASTLVALGFVLCSAAACGGAGEGEPVRVNVRPGAPFAEVADSLAARQIIRMPALFRLYARATGAATRIKPGPYGFLRNSSWRRVLDDLVAGRILTTKVTIPEGFTLVEIAPRVASVSGARADSLLAILQDSSTAKGWNVPGPSLEGYLYPATYTVPVDARPEVIIEQAVAAYRQLWSPARRARADSIGMSEHAVVTLASIVEKEAFDAAEMPMIAAVYRNRLRIGMALQADPTVQYALGGHRERLLFADIERVRHHPYNTYHRTGLPPGPIGSPSERAIDAVLRPADEDYLYFVARLDGTHVFTGTLAEHNRAKAGIERQRRAAARARAGASP
jgi:UPF0755 protein